MTWDSVRLGEFITVKHGFAFDGAFFSDSGKHVLLTPGNCHEGGGLKLRGEKERYFAGEIPDEYLLRSGDLLVVMTDLINTAPILGGAFFIPEDDRYLHNQRLGLVQVRDPSNIDKRFLYYLLNSHAYRAQVRGSASGATVRHTSPSRIENCIVAVPHDVSEQSRIAQTLGAYDDLIENNRRRIALLEQAARLLYEEWFVRFRFPGHEHAKFINGLPVGWELKRLGELCKDIREHAEPSELDADTPYIGLEHLPRRSITLCDWGKAEDVTSGKFRFGANDILFGKIRPYFHKVGFALTDGITSSDAIVIRPVEERVYFYCLCQLSSDGFVALASKTVKEGSKMPRADWKFLREQKFQLPPDGLLEDFNSKIAPITAQLKALALQTKKATAARDVLLPRLMSGEVEV